MAKFEEEKHPRDPHGRFMPLDLSSMREYTPKELDWEYEREYKVYMKGRFPDAFTSREDFQKKYDASLLRHLTIEELQGLHNSMAASGMGKDEKWVHSTFGHRRDTKRILAALTSGQTAPPIVLQSGNKLTLMAGQTRIAAGLAVGKIVPVKVINVTKKTAKDSEVTTMQMIDRLVVDEKSLRRTRDGYLTGYARVARTGVQIYRGYEVGKPEMDEVRVYRSPEEVFSGDTLHSFAHRPVTLDHPPVAVDASNWKKYAVGYTGPEVVKDGEFIRVPLVLMDADAIGRVEGSDGRAPVRELSMGYSTDLKFDRGITHDGQHYDAVQTAIRGNHLAVVAAARGGPLLRLGDEERGRKTMNDRTRTVTVDSIPVEMSEMAANVVSRALDAAATASKQLTDRAVAAETAAKTANDALAALQTSSKSAIDAKDGEIAVLKKQVEDGKLKPEQVDKIVADRLVVVGKARTILGDKLITKDKSDVDVMKQAVATKLGDAAVKDMSDDTVRGAFGALTADAKVQDGTRVLSEAFGGGGQHTTDGREAAFDKAGEHLRNAWKTPARTQ
jgi:hypothetical protein